jgi:2,4-dienoyl-CoA reductase-like NADH-dependent reductase (Old Yellow Enzyme family)
MSTNRDPRYDILFEPVQIGPVTAKNRFYQVPHCNGGGYRDPSAAAAMRRVKAEGGWGVIFTEQNEMHHSSEIAPYIELRLWDDDDIPVLAKMSDAIHEFDALAGTQLTYAGVNGPNLYSREVPLAPTAMPIRTYTSDPVSARAMTKKDIRDLRRWHRNACLRAKTAGFDLICLYAAHGHGIFQHFLSTATNQRSDEYGGSLENRSRLMRELVAECKDAVGDSIGITLRLSLPVHTPDDIMDGELPDGKVILFDDDHYYMGGVIAELLAVKGCEVTLVTPSAYVSAWSGNTLEQASVHARLVELGVRIVLNRVVSAIENGEVVGECVFSGQTESMPADSVAMVGSRIGRDALWQELCAREDEWAQNGIRSIKLIGDAESPAPADRLGDLRRSSLRARTGCARHRRCVTLPP